MTDTPHFLYRIFSPERFSSGQLQQILPQYSKVHFRKHDYLLHEGRTAQHYWFVENGFVRSYAVDTQGNDISTNFYTTGSIVIDWPSFFLRHPTRENIQALTDCSCWQIGFDQPNVALLSFPYTWLPAVVVPTVLLSHLLCLKKKSSA